MTARARATSSGPLAEPRAPAGPQQLRGAHDQEQGQRAGGGPQEPRRPLLEHEAPPQIVTVLDVPVAEEAEPEHAEQHRRDRHQPGGREALGEQRGLAVEGAPAGQQGEQRDRQDRRLLDMQAAQQAEARCPAARIPSVASQAPSSRRRSPQATSSSSRPAMLAKKCEISITPSGTMSPTISRRPATVGAALEASSMMPAVNTISANRLGASTTAHDADPAGDLARSPGADGCRAAPPPRISGRR